VPRLLYGDSVLSDMKLAGGGLREFGPDEWSDYTRRVAEPNSRPDRPFGAYAVETRKRRKAELAAHEQGSRCPFAAGLA
jgi:hypothetical protein